MDPFPRPPSAALCPVLIAGPTASGKSALALALAERLGGTVINADSMQVYAELRVLTARPSPAEEARAPHRLYGHVSLREAYSTGRWLADMAAALRATWDVGRRPVVVGGTGLYFRSLTSGISELPSVPPEVRRAVRARLAEEGAAALHSELERLDPDLAARVSPGDRQRILRGLEIHAATGRPLSDWQREPRSPPLVPPGEAVRLVLWPDREWLRGRIDLRAAEMLRGGAVEEAERVAALDLDPDLPGYRAHGLRPLLRHVRGEAGYDETLEQIRLETRRYAKRQFTWFRTQMADWPRAAPADAEETVLAGVTV